MTDRNYDDECGDHGGNGGDCGLAAGWGTDFDSGKCRFHRGTSPDGESHAGNQNAMKTGVHSDPVDLFDWLVDEDPGAVAYIFDKLHEYAQQAPREVFVVDVEDAESFTDAQARLTAYGDDLLLTCIRDYTRWRATRKQVKEGLITEQTVATDAGPVQVADSNPINLDLDRLDRSTVRQKDKLGLFPDDGADVEVSVQGQMWDNLTGHYED